MALMPCIAAWGQAQRDNSVGEKKVDRATAYYHYSLAHFYAKKALSGDADGEYRNKAIEHYQAAIKADPHTPMLEVELSKFHSKAPARVSPPVRRLPPRR
jgi:hypothetical protein